MRLITAFLVLMLLSCRSYVPHQPKKVKEAFPAECSELYKLVTEKWALHRKQKCHKYFDGIESFAFKNKQCILKLNKQDAEDLFGMPDEIGIGGGYYYYFKKDCSAKNDLRLSYFLIIFERDSIKSIDSGSKDFIRD
ncbi:MAG: hypothetical protein GC192_15295 [Bacteroidetes bacterium]|nr:hypothetical protein [Bacteroidota bacterium]